MPYEMHKDLHTGWQIWRDSESGAYGLAIAGRDAVLARDLPSIRWASVLEDADSSTLAVALYMVGGTLDTDEAKENFLTVIAHVANVKRNALGEGIRIGRTQIRHEMALAASPEFERVKAAAIRLTGAAPVSVDGMPWLAGVTGPGRTAQKAVFVYPWNVNRDAHRLIVETMRDGLGLPVTGAPDALHIRKSHCIVLAPTATYGTDSRMATSIDLRQDQYASALEMAHVEMREDGSMAHREDHAGPAPR